MPNSPVNAARELSASLHENTTQLREVQGELHKIKNRYRIVTACLIMTFVLLAGTLYTRYDYKKAACQEDNSLRSGLLHVADQLDDALESNPTNDAFVAGLREDFALRDCSGIEWL